MAKYIDLEKAIQGIEEDCSEQDYYSKSDAISSLRAQEAADVAPVVHGRWEWLGPNRLVTDSMCGTCSACKVRSKYIVNTMLCPNCGARMDGAGNGD